jgi:hypothetical protein
MKTKLILLTISLIALTSLTACASPLPTNPPALTTDTGYGIVTVAPALQNATFEVWAMPVSAPDYMTAVQWNTNASPTPFGTNWYLVGSSSPIYEGTNRIAQMPTVPSLIEARNVGPDGECEWYPYILNYIPPSSDPMIVSVPYGTNGCAIWVRLSAAPMNPPASLRAVTH